jgi:predicted deacylase
MSADRRVKVKRAPFRIGEASVAPGTQAVVDLPVSKLSNHTPVTLPVRVFHGRRDGPTLFVSGVIHGDEIIGVEIIRRLCRVPALRRLRGTLLCIPIVNVFGFISHSRYLPDRRDLNRSFPGSPHGSLAAQLAHLFTNEIVARADVGIDLHSAALNRMNLPQIRLDFTHEHCLQLAKAFGVAVVINSPERPGSLRQTAKQHDVEVMTFEAGEALRFDEIAVRAGVRGILRVMKALGMVAARSVADARTRPTLSEASAWTRASEAGILRTFKTPGESVTTDDVLGVIANPYEDIETEVRAIWPGLIIGRTNLPVVNQGDALFHIARVPSASRAERKVGAIATELQGDPLFDEDEII